MARTDYQTVDEYIAAQPEPARPTLEAVRQLIRKAAPEATEAISYQIPAYRLHGILVYFGGWKEHFSLYPVPADLPEQTAAEIAPYISGRGTLKFSYAKPVPKRLITALVKHQVAANLRKHDAQRARRASKGT